MKGSNYCTLEMARRLVKAGIVLETEFVWRSPKEGNPFLTNAEPMRYSTDIPATSMAEVWREFKIYEIYLTLEANGETLAWIEWSVDSYRKGSPPIRNTNPTDALCELLIWVKGQYNGR